MKHVFISREGDKEQFVKNFERQKKLSNQELIAKYNNAVDMGIRLGFPWGYLILLKNLTFCWKVHLLYIMPSTLVGYD
jgi:hypothetical protein